MSASTQYTLKLVIQYDGTRFVGWQRQANGMSVQALLEEALHTITREQVHVEASGRTDAGVHAWGQVASVKLSKRVVPIRLRLSLNALLPEDVAVLSVEIVDDGFHARKSAKSKRYRYTIVNDHARHPLLRRTSFHYAQKLDVAAMQRAARALVGKHDFAAFVKETPRKRNCVRTILSASVTKNGVVLHVDVTGTGFLYNMVRIITGTLIEVGLGRRPESCIADLLQGAPREAAGFTVPPHGLALVEVNYSSSEVHDLPRTPPESEDSA
ncbi:MAG: tRNA pseudouridine(38-40) synthase TruA [Planctomycetes bacterium]|nr:tRNA pseudouridine(38-40) synthase TruA [Planctomycetota bacterium]